MSLACQPPVLNVAHDALREIHGGDALSSLWTLFTKCKESIHDGRRLENISWRLWYREMSISSMDHFTEPPWHLEKPFNIIPAAKSDSHPLIDQGSYNPVQLPSMSDLTPPSMSIQPRLSAVAVAVSSTGNSYRPPTPPDGESSSPSSPSAYPPEVGADMINMFRSSHDQNTTFLSPSPSRQLTTRKRARVGSVSVGQMICDILPLNPPLYFPSSSSSSSTSRLSTTSYFAQGSQSTAETSATAVVQQVTMESIPNTNTSNLPTPAIEQDLPSSFIVLGHSDDNTTTASGFTELPVDREDTLLRPSSDKQSVGVTENQREGVSSVKSSAAAARTDESPELIPTTTPPRHSSFQLNTNNNTTTAMRGPTTPPLTSPLPTPTSQPSELPILSIPAAETLPSMRVHVVPPTPMVDGDAGNSETTNFDDYDDDSVNDDVHIGAMSTLMAFDEPMPRFVSSLSTVPSVATSPSASPPNGATPLLSASGSATQSLLLPHPPRVVVVNPTPNPTPHPTPPATPLLLLPPDRQYALGRSTGGGVSHRDLDERVTSAGLEEGGDRNGRKIIAGSGTAGAGSGLTVVSAPLHHGVPGSLEAPTEEGEARYQVEEAKRDGDIVSVKMEDVEDMKLPLSPALSQSTTRSGVSGHAGDDVEVEAEVEEGSRDGEDASFVSEEEEGGEESVKQRSPSIQGGGKGRKAVVGKGGHNNHKATTTAGRKLGKGVGGRTSKQRVLPPSLGRVPSNLHIVNNDNNKKGEVEEDADSDDEEPGVVKPQFWQGANVKGKNNIVDIPISPLSSTNNRPDEGAHFLPSPTTTVHTVATAATDHHNNVGNDDGDVTKTTDVIHHDGRAGEDGHDSQSRTTTTRRARPPFALVRSASTGASSSSSTVAHQKRLSSRSRSRTGGVGVGVSGTGMRRSATMIGMTSLAEAAGAGNALTSTSTGAGAGKGKRRSLGSMTSVAGAGGAAAAVAVLEELKALGGKGIALPTAPRISRRTKSGSSGGGGGSGHSRSRSRGSVASAGAGGSSLGGGGADPGLTAMVGMMRMTRVDSAGGMKRLGGGGRKLSGGGVGVRRVGMVRKGSSGGAGQATATLAVGAGAGDASSTAMIRDGLGEQGQKQQSLPLAKEREDVQPKEEKLKRPTFNIGGGGSGGGRGGSSHSDEGSGTNSKSVGSGSSVSATGPLYGGLLAGHHVQPQHLAYANSTRHHAPPLLHHHHPIANANAGGVAQLVPTPPPLAGAAAALLGLNEQARLSAAVATSNANTNAAQQQQQQQLLKVVMQQGTTRPATTLQSDQQPVHRPQAQRQQTILANNGNNNNGNNPLVLPPGHLAHLHQHLPLLPPPVLPLAQQQRRTTIVLATSESEYETTTDDEDDDEEFDEDQDEGEFEDGGDHEVGKQRRGGGGLDRNGVVVGQDDDGEWSSEEMSVDDAAIVGSKGKGAARSGAGAGGGGKGKERERGGEQGKDHHLPRSKDKSGGSAQSQLRLHEQQLQRMQLQQQYQHQRQQQQQLQQLQGQQQPPHTQHQHHQPQHQPQSRHRNLHRQQNPKDVQAIVEQAALEAKRQLDMFAKVPVLPLNHNVDASATAAAGGVSANNPRGTNANTTLRAPVATRTQSVGLLSQLMNPDPRIFPVEHPYRRGFSSGEIGSGGGGRGVRLQPLSRMTPPPPSPQVPQSTVPPHLQQRNQQQQQQSTKRAVVPQRRHSQEVSSRGLPPGGLLQMSKSKSSVAVPLGSWVSAGLGPDPPALAGLDANVMATANTTNATTNATAGLGGGYRPKGRPPGQEMDDDSEDESESGVVDVSKSVVAERLKALAEKSGIMRSKAAGQHHRQQQQPLVGAVAAEEDDHEVPIWARVQSTAANDVRGHRRQPQQQTSRLHPQPHPQPIPAPTLITLGHPYNLPPPVPPSTPRTTRRLMLQTELSESLRMNLLWERRVGKLGAAGVVRRSWSGGVPGVPGQEQQQPGGSGQQQQPSAPRARRSIAPLTTTPSMVQLVAKKPKVDSENGQPSTQQQPGPVHQQPQQPEAEEAPNPGEREELRRKAMARNRSWQDDFHFKGW